MFNRLSRLRHYAVVCGHHQNYDVGDLRASRTHGRESLVTRGVQEGNRTVGGCYAIGANVLRNATGLASGNLRLPDIVEQRGFTVVDVAHDGHHRCAVMQHAAFGSFE